MQNEINKNMPSRSNITKIKLILVSKIFLVIIIVIQFAIIVLLINPGTVLSQIQNNRIIVAVASKTSTNTQETPVVAVISDANALRDENLIQADIYKDAQNGDYVLGFTNKMIIYRQQNDSIIYDGDAPQVKLDKTQKALILDIITIAKKSVLIDPDSKETPQVSLITDAKTLREENASFYKDARNDDILVFFTESQVVMVYRQESKSIIKSGSYNTAIK